MPAAGMQVEFPITAEAHKSMQRQQPTERALYVPKGRRELIVSSDVKNDEAASKKWHPREETVGEDPAVKTKSNSRASSSSPSGQSTILILNVKLDSLGDSTKQNTSLPSRRLELYVPKGRRELNEKTAPIVPSTQTQRSTLSSEFKAKDNVFVQSIASAAPKQAVAPTVDSIPISELALNRPVQETKPKDTTWGIYIPKGRRELNDKKSAESDPPVRSSSSGSRVAAAKANTKSLTSAGADDHEASDLPIPPREKLSAYTKWDESSGDEFDNEDDEDDDADEGAASVAERAWPPPPPSQEEVIGDACLLLSGLPAEMSEMARGNITRPYLDKGATLRWVSASECLIVFKSDRIAAGAVPPAGSSIFRVVRLRDVALPARAAHIDAVRDLFVAVKPERDSTVANRLIGAALGIRLPPPAKTAASSAETSNRSRARAPSPPRQDAWDD